MKIVTHNGTFHADDVFAFATLSLAVGGNNIELTRTRDPEIISTADVVFDVGREYDSSKKRFDHHQEGGAGKRANGIPYSSFGLIWKEYASKICSEEEAELIDQKLVQVVDAIDSGYDLSISKLENVQNYDIGSVIGSLNPTSIENDKTSDEQFAKALEIAKLILSRELAFAKEFQVAKKIVKDACENAEDKRIILIETDIKKSSLQSALMDYPEVLYAVLPYDKNWSIRAARKSLSSFECRKPLPAEWAGKSEMELQKITGVSDVIFCHNARFIASARSKEGAMALAKLALKS